VLENTLAAEHLPNQAKPPEMLSGLGDIQYEETFMGDQGVRKGIRWHSKWPERWTRDGTHEKLQTAHENLSLWASKHDTTPGEGGYSIEAEEVARRIELLNNTINEVVTACHEPNWRVEERLRDAYNETFEPKMSSDDAENKSARDWAVAFTRAGRRPSCWEEIVRRKRVACLTQILKKREEANGYSAQQGGVSGATEAASVASTS
jgi:hypothetical protein